MPSKRLPAVLAVEIVAGWPTTIADGTARVDRGNGGGRHADEIAEWAVANQLPMRDEHVQFPDVRVEYDDRDGRPGIEDLEVLTPTYGGAHAAVKTSSGFTCYRAIGARLGVAAAPGVGVGEGLIRASLRNFWDDSG